MINSMATLLPADSELDYVADVTGDESWRWEEGTRAPNCGFWLT